MKPVFIILLFAGAGGILACKKDHHPKSKYLFVYLNHCISENNDSDRIQLCFDAVVSDNRCPVNAFCITEGTAVAKFTFTKDGASHKLTLSTQPLNTAYGKDTIIENYKIEFVDLKPYKVAGETPPSGSQINAEVKISSP
jgi:hypothetical protein